MSAFTILTHGNEPSGEASVGIPAQPPGAKRRTSPPEPARAVPDAVGFEEASLPQVVLQLPDLKASSRWSRSVTFPVASKLYWIALVLGAGLALWLITSGKKPAEQSMGEAPAWTRQEPVHVPSAGGAWSDNAGEAAPQTPSWQASNPDANLNSTLAPSQATPVSEPTESSLAPGDTGGATAPHDPRYAPGAAVQSTEATPDIRTARGGETRWDGSSNPVPPGEAAPLGITTPVP